MYTAPFRLVHENVLVIVVKYAFMGIDSCVFNTCYIYSTNIFGRRADPTWSVETKPAYERKGVDASLEAIDGSPLPAYELIDSRQHIRRNY